MKIRWNSQSVRLRISPSELASLEKGEAVEETLRLGGASSWRARLEPAASTGLKTSGVVLSFSLSAADLARLTDAENEGVYFTLDGFRYFVEKDFPCAHPRAAEAAEPAAETFEPPVGFEERKSSGQGLTSTELKTT